MPRCMRSAGRRSRRAGEDQRRHTDLPKASHDAELGSHPSAAYVRFCRPAAWRQILGRIDGLITHRHADRAHCQDGLAGRRTHSGREHQTQSGDDRPAGFTGGPTISLRCDGEKAVSALTIGANTRDPLNPTVRCINWSESCRVGGSRCGVYRRPGSSWCRLSRAC